MKTFLAKAIVSFWIVSLGSFIIFMLGVAFKQNPFLMLCLLVGGVALAALVWALNHLRNS